MSCHGNIVFMLPATPGASLVVGVDSQGSPEILGRKIAKFLAGAHLRPGGWSAPKKNSPDCFWGMEDLVIRLITYLKGDPSVPGGLFMASMQADYVYRIYQNSLGEINVRVYVYQHGVVEPQTIFLGTGTEMLRWVDLLEGKTDVTPKP